MKKFTVELLEKAKACQDQVSLFKELFSNGVVPSVEAAVSVADKFVWDFAARRMLSPNGFKAYWEAKALHWKAYEEAEAKTFAELWTKENTK